MRKILVFLYCSLFTIHCSLLSASVMEEGELIREKQEVSALKKELNEFYEKKEAEYQKRKKVLEAIYAKVQEETKYIEELYKKNEDNLTKIQGKVASKKTKIYNAIKPKILGKIFNKMIKEDKIDEVFDIILIMKAKKITNLMKFLTIENSAMITELLNNYKKEK